jgi:hypothetical protein
MVPEMKKCFRHPANATSVARVRCSLGKKTAIGGWRCRQGGRCMADPDLANAALKRAWSVYLLINSDVDRNDARRATLERFIHQRCEAGTDDSELLAVDGLKYLKQIDAFGNESFE